MDDLLLAGVPGVPGVAGIPPRTAGVAPSGMGMLCSVRTCEYLSEDVLYFFASFFNCYGKQIFCYFHDINNPYAFHRLKGFIEKYLYISNIY